MNRALEFLQAVYANNELPLVTRMRAAMACLPFECPRLAVTALVDNQRDFATILDRRVKHMNELNGVKMIEATPTRVEPPRPDRRCCYEGYDDGGCQSAERRSSH
jgi:hypothetical protein